MKKIGFNAWLINQQKENRLERHKKITMFRRYWDSTNKEYTWEDQITQDIDQDIIKCGKISWKADTDQLNIWKMGNVSLEVDNTHGKWDINKSDSYFSGSYIAFLSMIRLEVGFVAEDGTIYEVFTYQGLISQNGIQIDNEKHTAKIKVISLDYLLSSIDAEKVSRRPIDPELQYDNADIYSSTTIGKTGSGWGVNTYQYNIVKIVGGTGIGQERMIQSNTATTLTVTAWTTTPDSTSDFEIVGELLGTGTGGIVDFTTIQPGVGKVTKTWVDDVEQYQGDQYNTSQINEPTLGAKITFSTAPSAGKKIIADYIYWYQNETFKFLIEKILDLANVTNRFVQDVTFPEGIGIQVEWLQTIQGDWNAGILFQGETTRYPGDIIADDNETTHNYEFWGSVPDSGSSYFDINGSQWQCADKFIAMRSAYLSQMSIRAIGMSGFNGVIRMAICADDAGGSQPGTELAVEEVSPTSSWSWLNFNFTPDLLRLVKPSPWNTKTYWIKLRTLYYSTGWARVETNSSYSGFYYYDTSWHSVGMSLVRKQYLHPYYTYATHFSQTHDAGATLTSWGKIDTSATLNGGSILYYTQTRDTDSGWSTTWNVAEWDAVDAFDNITSPVRRYIRVAVYINTPAYPTATSDDIQTVNLHEYTIRYYKTEYKPTLANFTDKNGKSGIETIAKLANYEMGFFTDFDDSLNMTWDVEYDGSVLPQSDTPAWVETKTGDSVGSIFSGILNINGTTGVCYYSIIDTDLDPRNGWTVEAYIQKISGNDEGFQIIVNDGTFHTRVGITNQGYIKLLQYNKDNITKSKKADFSIGDFHKLKIARKGTIVKIYVDELLILMSHANNTSALQNIIFGQIEGATGTYQNSIDWLRYNDSVPSFETFYLPKYYFQSKDSIIDSSLILTADEYYTKLYQFNYGWDRVYNHIKVTYGDYTYYANPVSEFDERPHSEDKYGKKLLTVSGEDFLKADDVNVTISTAKSYYVYYKLPRRKFKLLCRFLFQLNLSNKIYVTVDEPFSFTALPCKIVGIVLNIDQFTLDLDCEEII